jgi:hypothetical protein
MALRPKHQVEAYEKATVLDMPCGFCCTMMPVPRELYEQGGIYRCPKCKMAVKFKKHKIKVAKRTRKFNIRNRINVPDFS